MPSKIATARTVRETGLANRSRFCLALVRPVLLPERRRLIALPFCSRPWRSPRFFSIRSPSDSQPRRTSSSASALALAPIGAWIAQTEHIDLAPVILGAGVLCWVAGFDLIYATQDYDFDRREGIHSLVVKLGIPQALRLAQLLHLTVLIALVAFGLTAKLGIIYIAQCCRGRSAPL